MSGGAKKSHPHWGRRKRRLKTTATVVAVAALAGLGVVLFLRRSSEPETYRPGEEMADITQNLARDLPSGAPLPRFTDVTAEAGLGGFRSFAGERSSQLPEDMGSGLAWGDVDRDGDDDLFLVSNGGALGAEPAPSELYENVGGSFRKVAGFPEPRIVGMAAAWGDADGDGWIDLVVTGYRALLLYKNDGGRFVRSDALPEVDGYWAGATWGDYDNDGDLDLYVCGYVRYVEAEGSERRTSTQYGAAVPYTLNPSSYDPERNLLFRNDGGRFTEVAELLGVSNPDGRSLGALWHDFDDDGWLDLYVGNDVSDNVLYRNRGGTFEDSSLASWVADYRGAMGLAAGDYDRDGDDDLYVTHWVGQENALYDSLFADMAAAGGGEGGEGGGRVELGFSDRAAPLGLGQVALRFVGWGTSFADLDADGWLDLLVANGSTFENPEPPKRLKPQEPQLFWNQAGEYFHDLAPLVPALAEPRAGRGLAVADYDQDGDLDVALMVHDGGVQLLRNDMEQGHWVELRLRDRRGADAYGARVEARLGELVLRRTVGGSSYLSQSSAVVHLGLGEAERVDELVVHWPAGEPQTWIGVDAGVLWELTEGEDEPRRIEGGGEASAAVPEDDKERILAFWEKHRAAMKALKVGGDCAQAAPLFREALELDPTHEDARYYLSQCLVEADDVEAALAELEVIKRRNPQSLRAFKQWGTLRALTARSHADYAAARESLERAIAINKEETGALLVLGEVALIEGDLALAETRFEWACRTNPRAVGGFYLRAYVAKENGDLAAARELLVKAQEARGPEWKPEGTAAEGDVARRMHRESSPLAHFWKSWDGTPDPDLAFADLDRFLETG